MCAAHGCVTGAQGPGRWPLGAHGAAGISSCDPHGTAACRYGEDKWGVKYVLENWMRQYSLQALPVFGLGISAGASFVLRLPKLTRVNGIISGAAPPCLKPPRPPPAVARRCRRAPCSTGLVRAELGAVLLRPGCGLTVLLRPGVGWGLPWLQRCWAPPTRPSLWTTWGPPTRPPFSSTCRETAVSPLPLAVGQLLELAGQLAGQAGPGVGTCEWPSADWPHPSVQCICVRPNARLRRCLLLCPSLAAMTARIAQSMQKLMENSVPTAKIAVGGALPLLCTKRPAGCTLTAACRFPASLPGTRGTMACPVWLMARRAVPAVPAAPAVQVDPRPVTRSFFSDRSEFISPELSRRIVSGLHQIGMIDDAGMVTSDPRYTTQVRPAPAGASWRRPRPVHALAPLSLSSAPSGLSARYSRAGVLRYVCACTTPATQCGWMRACLSEAVNLWCSRGGTSWRRCCLSWSLTPARPRAPPPTGP